LGPTSRRRRRRQAGVALSGRLANVTSELSRRLSRTCVGSVPGSVIGSSRMHAVRAPPDDDCCTQGATSSPPSTTRGRCRRHVSTMRLFHFAAGTKTRQRRHEDNVATRALTTSPPTQKGPPTYLSIGSQRPSPPRRRATHEPALPTPRSEPHRDASSPDAQGARMPAGESGRRCLRWTFLTSDATPRPPPPAARDVRAAAAGAPKEGPQRRRPFFGGRREWCAGLRFRRYVRRFQHTRNVRTSTRNADSAWPNASRFAGSKDRCT
jgi:hypothetical protein